VHDKVNRPSVVVITWGEAESLFPRQARLAMDGALADAVKLGVTVVAAAGDFLAPDQVNDGKAHVDYPASSPYVLGCGGTAITLDAAGAAITAEAVWNDGFAGTGGGVSDLYLVPAFQKGVPVPTSVNGSRKGRGVPDVAAAAAPLNGYRVILNGQPIVTSGTSAAAPLWAAAVALANAERGKPLGFLNTRLYQQAAALHPIASGHNRPQGTQLGYPARGTWSACTGLGVPRGADLLRALTAAV
jgi:kumamolisin